MTKGDDNGEIKQSLADRLKALKTNQDNWKNRINKEKDLEINNALLKKRISIDNDIFRKNDRSENDKYKSSKPQTTAKLADRLQSLEKSAKQWRNRVADKDNQKFTISGKMASIDYTMNNNNLKLDKNSSKTDQSSKIEFIKKENLINKDKKKEIPKTESIFKKKSTISKNVQVSKKEPIKKTELVFKNESINCETKEPIIKNNSTLTTKITSNNLELSRPKSIELPKLDANFDTFFKPVKLEKITSSPDKESEDFFDEIDQLTSSLLVIKKSVKLTNRKATTGNPLKKMQNTSDFIENSIELKNNSSKTNSADLIKRPTKSTSISSSIRKDLDPTAKAGLESREDYKLVANKLKKSSENQECHLDSNNLLSKKSTTKCLIQVKGRKKVQVRVVEPSLKSINEGDSYILITNNLVIIWIGRFTNIIERTKVLDVGNKIFKRRELGFKNGKLIIIDNDKKSSTNDLNTFKNLIKDDSNGESNDFSSAGNEEEDDVYENQIIKTNKIYILDQDKFVFRLCEDMCSKQLYQQQLNPYEAFLFDFQTEVYVWLGFYLTNECRNTAIELAQELFSQTKINRPNYSIFYKINQNMESILFQEKFFDWLPNLKHKAKSCSNDEYEKRMNLKTFDVDEMLKPVETTDFLLDNTCIGRGDFYEDVNELLYIEIVTDNIKCWHINEYEKKEIKDQELGQFLDTETYVVRWQYRINRLGNLDKKKLNEKLNDNSKSNDTNKINESKEENIFKKADRVNFRKHKETLDNNVTGRERFCYFYWQGLNALLASKAAAALMTIEIDKEKGSQIQVKQTEEPPPFLRLFKGNFVIYNNKYQDQISRLFLVKGLYSEEAFLYEVECEVNSLRSKGCFVLVNFNSKSVYLWIGKNANSDQVKIANQVCQNINIHHFSSLKNNKFNNSQLKFTCTTVKQSFETIEFLNHFTFNSLSLSQIKSTIKSLVVYDVDQELIIFHLTSLSGEFSFNRLTCTYSSNNQLVNNFPFEQKRLYSANQPAFFLIDNGQTIYLWQGHFPKNDENVLTGSINVRYSQEKKCALETVLSYCHRKYPNKSIEAYLIHAGLEPKSFIQLFPEWTVDEEIKEIQLKDGKKENEMNPIREVLARICNLKNIYKLDDLKKKPLPDGINELILESYLSDEEFKESLKMNKKKFYLLPVWRQNELKQTAGLF